MKHGTGYLFTGVHNIKQICDNQLIINEILFLSDSPLETYLSLVSLHATPHPQNVGSKANNCQVNNILRLLCNPRVVIYVLNV